MKVNTNNSQSLWVLAAKVTAIGLSLVLATYSLVWILLSTLRIVMEGVID